MEAIAKRPNGQHNGNGKIKEADLSHYVFGKVQPQAVPLEEAVLGAVMLDREILPIVGEILKPESFYLESHRAVFSACLRLFRRGDPVDLLTVTEEMRKCGEIEMVNGGYYLVELSHRVASAANTEYHSRIIAQKATARAIIAIATRAIKEAYEDTTDIFTALDELETAILKIRIWENRGIQRSEDLTAAVLRDLEHRAQNKGLVGLPSGITDLDRKTGGFQKTDLIIVAARPGMGKTGFAASCALFAAKEFGKSVGFFTLEMSAEQIMKRIISIDAEIDSEKMRNGTLEDSDWQKVQVSVERVGELPIYTDDTAAIGILELRAKVRRMKQMFGIEAVFVDYLQLMTGERLAGANREQEMASVSRALKALAKEMDLPVIALAQLSRATETRGGSKRPQLSDLRETGSIENDADIVAFIYRPEYYGIMDDGEGNSLIGRAEIIVAKNRHGSLGTVLCQFDAPYTRFCDIDTFKGLPPFAPTDYTIPQNALQSSRANGETIPF